MKLSDDKKKIAGSLIITTLILSTSINTLINSINKGEFWRIAFSGIPTVIFGIFAIILFIKLQKLNK